MHLFGIYNFSNFRPEMDFELTVMKPSPELRASTMSASGIWLTILKPNKLSLVGRCNYLKIHTNESLLILLALPTLAKTVQRSKTYLFTFFSPPIPAAIFSTLIHAYITYVDSPANSWCLSTARRNTSNVNFFDLHEVRLISQPWISTEKQATPSSGEVKQ